MHNRRHTNRRHEHWSQSRWRSFMGMAYIVINVFDFIIAPILWSVVQILDNDGVITSQWNPLTLQGAGLFHMAMGAVLGVAAYTRGRDKEAEISGGDVNTSYTTNSPDVSNK